MVLSHGKKPVSDTSELYSLQVPWLSADSTNIRKFGIGMGKIQASMKGDKNLMEAVLMYSGKPQHLCSLSSISYQDSFSYGQI